MGLKDFFAKMLGKQTEEAQAPQTEAVASTEQPQTQSTPKMVTPTLEVGETAPQSIEDVEKMPEPEMPETPNGEEKK